MKRRTRTREVTAYVRSLSICLHGGHVSKILYESRLSSYALGGVEPGIIHEMTNQMAHLMLLENLLIYRTLNHAHARATSRL